MLGKLLGKKSGYYLELSEEEISAIPEPTEMSSPKAPEAEIDTQVSAAVGIEEENVETDAPASADSGPATDVMPVADNKQKKKKKKKNIKKSADAEPESLAPVVVPLSDSVEIIRTAIAAAGNQSAPKPEPAPTPTFDYTTPVAKASRRRPGPSMSPFKGMVKEMKRTTSGF